MLHSRWSGSVSGDGNFLSAFCSFWRAFAFLSDITSLHSKCVVRVDATAQRVSESGRRLEDSKTDPARVSVTGYRQFNPRTTPNPERVERAKLISGDGAESVTGDNRNGHPPVRVRRQGGTPGHRERVTGGGGNGKVRAFRVLCGLCVPSVPSVPSVPATPRKCVK